MLDWLHTLFVTACKKTSSPNSNRDVWMRWTWRYKKTSKHEESVFGDFNPDWCLFKCNNLNVWLSHKSSKKRGRWPLCGPLLVSTCPVFVVTHPWLCHCPPDVLLLLMYLVDSLAWMCYVKSGFIQLFLMFYSQPNRLSTETHHAECSSAAGSWVLKVPRLVSQSSSIDWF